MKFIFIFSACLGLSFVGCFVLMAICKIFIPSITWETIVSTGIGCGIGTGIVNGIFYSKKY